MTDKSFRCPHCGAEQLLSDSDVYPLVTSYHGDDIHDYSCPQCEGDFLVNEIVSRSYLVGKTYDDFHRCNNTY